MRKFSNIVSAILVYAISLLIVLFSGQVVRGMPLWAQLLLPELAFVVLVLVALTIRGGKNTIEQIQSCLPINKCGFRKILGAIGIFIGAYAAMSGVSYLEYLLPFLQEDSSGYYEAYSSILDTLSPVMSVVLLCVVPAICEEILYRGYLLSTLKDDKHPLVPCVIVAVMFGAGHFSLAKFLPTAILGFALCYITLKTGSIAIAIILHMLNNAYSIVTISQLSSTVQEATSQAANLPSYYYIISALISFGFATGFILSARKLLKDDKTNPPKDEE